MGLRKNLFFTLSIDRIILSKAGNAFLVVQDVDVAPDPPSLLYLHPRVTFRGKMSAGYIQGSISRTEGAWDLKIAGTNIQMKGVALLEKYGLQGDGALSFRFQQTGGKRQVNFSADETRFKGAWKVMPALPLNLFTAVKGSLVEDGIISIRSLTLEGTGIYARLTGQIANNRLDGNIEIMTDPPFAQYPQLQLALKPYLSSPGHYVIPISQPLSD